jgi:DNA primase
MIARKSIDEVMEIARIDEVVADFVNLKRRGSNMIGLCPFHNEKTPSFSVSPSKNIFKCFGCGRGGDSVRFVMEHEGYEYPEAIRYLAEKYGIKLEETKADTETLLAERERETIYKVLEFALEFYKKQLHETEEGQLAGLNYLKERGFRTKTIENFGLGYAPDKPDLLVKEALKAGFTTEILQKAALVNQHGGDFFRNRVIFPIFNISGKAIAFAGRQLINTQRGPKYINSPETDIYLKRKVLYGIFNAKKAIRQEGYTDVISLFQSGVENVVASSGTALTPDQIRLIKRYTGRITMLYDSDPAGVKAAMRGLDLILEEDMDVRLALLPEGDDPDSFIKREGLKGFQDYIAANSKDFILFKTQLLLKEAAGDPMRKSALVKDLVETLARIPEAIKRSAFITECAHLMNIEERILVRETNKALSEFMRQKQRGVPREIGLVEKEIQDKVFQQEEKKANASSFALPDLTDEFQERDIIRILLNYGDQKFHDEHFSSLAEYVIKSLSDILDDFQHAVYKRIIFEYKSLLDTQQTIGTGYFTNHPDPDVQRLTVELLTTPYEYASWDEHDIPLQIQLHPDKNYKLDAHNAILRLKLKIVMTHITSNMNQIARLQEEGNEEEMIIHMRMHNDLLQLREQITSQFKNVVLKV